MAALVTNGPNKRWERCKTHFASEVLHPRALQTKTRQPDHESAGLPDLQTDFLNYQIIFRANWISLGSVAS